MGQHASDTAQIILENCRVPASTCWARKAKATGSPSPTSKPGASASLRSIGMARAAFEAAVRYAKERVTFGQPIIEHQAVNFRLADMATLLDAARLMVWRAASSRTPASPV
jgi:butyryl-CoA dehydrogenase